MAPRLLYIASPAGPVWADDYKGDFSEAEYLTVASPSFEADTGARSLSMWVEFNKTTINQRLFMLSTDSTNSDYGYWTLHYHKNSNTLRVQFREHGVSGTPLDAWSWTPSTGTLYHVVLTSSGTDLKAYVDGSALTRTTNGLSGEWWGDCNFPGTDTTTACIGAFYRNSSTVIQPMDGTVNEVTYWNTELDSTEVSELYNSGTTDDPNDHSESANLDGYWALEQDLTDSVNSDDFTGAGGWGAGNFIST